MGSRLHVWDALINSARDVLSARSTSRCGSPVAAAVLDLGIGSSVASPSNNRQQSKGEPTLQAHDGGATNHGYGLPASSAPAATVDVSLLHPASRAEFLAKVADME